MLTSVLREAESLRLLLPLLPPLLHSLPPPSWRASQGRPREQLGQEPGSPDLPQALQGAPGSQGQQRGPLAHDQAEQQGDSQARPSAEEAAGCSR
jgi:hypothetical protein